MGDCAASISEDWEDIVVVLVEKRYAVHERAAHFNQELQVAIILKRAEMRDTTYPTQGIGQTQMLKLKITLNKRDGEGFIDRNRFGREKSTPSQPYYNSYDAANCAEKGLQAWR